MNKVENTGKFLRTVRGNPPATVRQGEAKTMIEFVVGEVREDILSGAYAPGSRLHVEKLRKKFNVGISTIREALSRLMVESLVMTEGQRGFWVTEISLKDFLEIAEMRKILETIAVRKSIENGDDEWEARVVSNFHLLSRAEERLLECRAEQKIQHERLWGRLNKEFHNTLAAASGNRWLMRFRRTLHDQSERYIRLSLQQHGAEHRDVHEEHKAIFDAVMAREADLASALLSRHIDKTVATVSENLGIGDDFKASVPGNGDFYALVPENQTDV
jgi:DNA-binding GntR family transcriptional regulator